MKALTMAAVLTIGFGPLARAGLDSLILEPPEVMRAYAEAGDPTSQYNYALLCQKGESVPKDDAQALTWYRKAAQSRLPEAENNLAVLLMKSGGDAAKNMQEAVALFTDAAVQGSFEAQRALITAHALGLGTKKDPVEALKWDFLARRSLELRFEVPAGAPDKPAKLRGDGFAEYIAPNGLHEAVGPDGSIETMGAHGERVIRHPDGSETFNSDAGGRETRFPNGVRRTEYPGGRTVTRNPNGTMETREADGTREVSGAGKSDSGEPVRVVDKFSKDNVRISRRIIGSDFELEQFPDGGRQVESKGEDDSGRKIRVLETFDKEGALVTRRLIRDDGVERKGDDVWYVKRWLHQKDGSSIQVREKFVSSSSLEGQEILAKRPPPGDRKATGNDAQGAVVSRPPENASASFVMPIRGIDPESLRPPVMGTLISGYRRTEDVMRPKPSIEAQLAELGKAEKEARYFAGATDADYEKLRGQAQHYMMSLSATPQRAQAGSWLNQRLAQTEAPPPPPPLVALPTDRSETYPLGMNGRAIIKQYPWKTSETEHFVIHYIQATEARPAVRYIECAYFAATQMLQIDGSVSRRKMHVFLFPGAEAWSSYKQSQGQPPNLEGFAYKDELILGAYAERDPYLKVLCHEATHAVVAHFYPGRKWPLWLNEGFAEYSSAKSIALARGHHLERYLDTNIPLPIKGPDIFNRIHYGTSGDVVGFYGQSEHCVRTLLEKLPAQDFPRFANFAFAGDSIPACLREVYGSDGDKFEALVNSFK